MWTGALHGIFGLGAFASPQAATAMISRGLPVRLQPFNFGFLTNRVYSSIISTLQIWA